MLPLIMLHKAWKSQTMVKSVVCDPLAITDIRGTGKVTLTQMGQDRTYDIAFLCYPDQPAGRQVTGICYYVPGGPDYIAFDDMQDWSVRRVLPLNEASQSNFEGLSQEVALLIENEIQKQGIDIS